MISDTAIQPGPTRTFESTRGVENGRLKKAAQDFEAMLLKDLLKAGSDMASIDGSEESRDTQGYDDFRVDAVANALASSGGVGIARMLLTQLGKARRQIKIKDFSSSADNVIAGEYYTRLQK